MIEPDPRTRWPHDWRTHAAFIRLYDKLAFLHGAERAVAIVQGRDAATNADMAAWRRVGAR